MSDAMVLRSLHLPVKLDDHLRALAFQLHCSKSELMRFFAVQGLHNIYDAHNGHVTRERLDQMRDHVQEAAQSLVDDLPAEFPLVVQRDERAARAGRGEPVRRTSRDGY